MEENHFKLQKISESDLREYYDAFGEWYEQVWNEQIHTGRFDTQKTLEKAIHDANTFLAEKGEVRPGAQIITVGCGRGGVDRFLAKEHQALVTGVDLSHKQLLAAREKAKKEGLEDKIKYVEGSMEKLPLLNESADYVWAQKSFFYCNDKEQTVQEFKRVLRTGGKVIIEDTTLEDKIDQLEVAKLLGKRIGAGNLITFGEYVDLFKRNGFTLLFNENWSQYLADTYRAIIKNIDLNRKEILKKMIPIYGNHTSSIDQKFGFPVSLKLAEEGKIGCRVFVFKKE
ncbi:methyltransferase domain-containing protein [Patescibacteria group bacterium]|nr:methyltransferase domain-containing protein [Patescibacteria group bacterium]